MTKGNRKLLDLYNRANMLHNLAWEAKHVYEQEVNKRFKKISEKEQWDKVENKIHCLIVDNRMVNPKPNRAYSHSGDVGIFSFWHYDAKRRVGLDTRG